MNRFILSRLALGDLNEIWEHLLVAAGADIADRMIEAVRAGIEALVENPGLGHTRTDLADESLRFWLVDPYLIVYEGGSRPLAIARILHSARDVKAILDSRPATDAR